MGTKIAGREFVLVVEQSVVHLPKSALCAGRLCCLGRQLGAGVHVVQRQVPPDVAQVVPERDQQLAYDNFGLAAVGALVIAVLHERHGRVFAASDVIARGVDVVGQIRDVLGGPRDLARPD